MLTFKQLRANGEPVHDAGHAGVYAGLPEQDVGHVAAVHRIYL